MAFTLIRLALLSAQLALRDSTVIKSRARSQSIVLRVATATWEANVSPTALLVLIRRLIGLLVSILTPALAAQRLSTAELVRRLISALLATSARLDSTTLSLIHQLVSALRVITVLKDLVHLLAAHSKL